MIFKNSWCCDSSCGYAWNLILDAGYYAQHGVHLVGQQDINEVAPGKALAACITLPLPSCEASLRNSLRPYPGYGAISIFTPAYGSHYNSLQTQVTKRFSGGSTVTAGPGTSASCSRRS